MYQTVFLKISLVSLILCLSSCKEQNTTAMLPYYNTPDFTPVFFLDKKDINKQITHTISAFSCTDQNGKTISEKTIDGKIHVANFFFTSCGSICPVMMKHMKILQHAFENNSDVMLLSFSVTPWIDSVSRLHTYAVNNGIISPNWHLLTGDKADIYTLARRSYFAEEDLGFTKDSADFLHTEHILLVDKNRRIRGIYNGTLQLEVEQLQKDINELLKEPD